VLNVIKTIRHGVIDDFQALEKLYSHVFEQLKIKIDEFSVMITDPPLNSNKNKEKICELLMENFQTRGKNEGTKLPINK
jgi:actin-related protein